MLGEYETKTREENHCNDCIKRYLPLGWGLNTRVPECKCDLEV